jgi:AcrR family transcriptional regulator
MVTGTASKPRKAPVQQRSRETVAAILEAAARILAEEGAAGFNTNRVASRAGVSVGSLYQYFPNKQALVRSLLGQRIRAAEALRPEELKEGSTASVEEGIRASVRWHIATHLENPRLETVLNRLAADVLEEGEFEAFERHYEQAVRRFLERHAESLRVGDADVAAFLVMQLLHAASNRALVHHRAALEDGRLEKELSDMILRYLARD